MSFTDSLDLNPRFLFFSPVRTVAVDQQQLAEHVDHAIIALDGRAPVGGDCFVEVLNPFAGGDTLRVELWVSELGDFTCTYGFLVSSENGRIPYARGERTVVNVDPATHRPAKWDNHFVTSHAELRKDLPAYA
ncbi:MAG TPA: thioesterase family protein [Thermoanaerobaculia bacterium]|nr:thioesterase family protein [Thermoanaerobaculia bacterium]